MEPKVTVVIPFFQRERGLLRKAVLSVLRQVNFCNYDIIVVDDGSPVSAYHEIRDLFKVQGSLIRIIEQKNAGVAVARNRGLDAVTAETDYVAFLDSDDEWKESHIENAVFALGRGFDLYFSNGSRFNRKSSFESLIFSSKHHNIDENRKLFAYDGDLFDDILRKNFILTPTAVYRYKDFSSLRCPEGLLLGSDHVFWLSLALLTKRAVFSMNIECDIGKGINISESRVGWSSPLRLEGVAKTMALYIFIIKHFCLAIGQKLYVKDQLSKLRYEFTAVMIHNIKRGRPPDMRIVSKQFVIDPVTYLLLLPNSFKVIYHAVKNGLFSKSN